MVTYEHRSLLVTANECKQFSKREHDVNSNNVIYWYFLLWWNL